MFSSNFHFLLQLNLFIDIIILLYIILCACKVELYGQLSLRSVGIKMFCIRKSFYAAFVVIHRQNFTKKQLGIVSHGKETRTN